MLFLPIVLAADLGDIPGTNLNILKIIFGPDAFSVFPQSQPTAYGFLQYLVFPFLSLWMVLYGILEEIRIFRRKTSINAVVAFLMAIISGPTGALVIVVRTSFLYMGAFGFLAFIVLFFFGVVAWAGVRLWSFGAPWGKSGRQRAIQTFEIERDIGLLQDRYNDFMLARDYDHAKEVLDQIERLRAELREVHGTRQGSHQPAGGPH